MSHFMLKRFPKHDIYHFIYMLIDMENTFKAMQCQKCRKYFQEEMRITEHLQKTLDFFWFLLEDLIILDIFYKIHILNL